MASKLERVGMKLSGRRMSDYGSYKSQHDFTQKQLMTCLILRAYLKTTYRGLVNFLAGHGTEDGAEQDERRDTFQ